MVQQLLDKARQLSVSELTAVTDANNTAAIKLLTKAGFEKENIGWMLALADNGDELSESQTIVQFKRKT